MIRLIYFFILLFMPINSASITIDLSELPDAIRIQSLKLQYITNANVYEYSPVTITTSSFSVRIKYALGIPDHLMWTIIFDKELSGSVTHSGYHKLDDLILEKRSIFLKLRIDDDIILARTATFRVSEAVDLLPEKSSRPQARQRTYFGPRTIFLPRPGR